MRRILPLSILLSVLAVGCGTNDFGAATAPSIANASATASQPGPPNLGGEWIWSNLETLKMPPFLVEALQLEPEGPYTHARCESTGTMTIVQSGDTFSGTARRTSNNCTTRGGQPFQQPQAVFTVTDGRIQGRNVQFSLNSPTVSPCPHQVVITGSRDGMATTLSGTGHCILPGHPQSNSPIPLGPPAGTTKTLSWTAARP